MKQRGQKRTVAAPPSSSALSFHVPQLLRGLFYKSVAFSYYDLTESYSTHAHRSRFN